MEKSTYAIFCFLFSKAVPVKCPKMHVKSSVASIGKWGIVTGDMEPDGEIRIRYVRLG